MYMYGGSYTLQKHGSGITVLRFADSFDSAQCTVLLHLIAKVV